MENYTPNTEHTPKPRSAAQIAASRANGAKSKGPVTEEGKAISAQNARRHGLLSYLTVVDGERTEAFADLCAELVDQFQPANEHERNLVDTMIISIWRRSRALGIETAGLSQLFRKQTAATPTQQPGPQPGSFDIAFRALVNNPDERHALDLLHRYEARHTRAYDRALKSLLAYRKSSQTNPTPTDPDRPQTEPRASASGPNTPATPPPTPQNEPIEPKRPLNRRERRQLKWQKAHPRATS